LIVTKRKVAWYGDRDFEYTYSNSTKRALPWTNELLQLKAMVEKQTGEQFNSCLLNLYHNGDEGMAWHSDAHHTNVLVTPAPAHKNSQQAKGKSDFQDNCSMICLYNFKLSLLFPIQSRSFPFPSFHSDFNC